MPLFTYPIAPLALYADDPLVGSSQATIAGQAFLACKELQAPITIAQMRCIFSGSPTGNVDMGIYDASDTNGSPGNLLGHTGAILSATGVYTQNLTANLLLLPGVYWIAFLDTVADSVWIAAQSSGQAVCKKSNSTALTVLPNSLAGATANGAKRVAVLALRSGGYS